MFVKQIDMNEALRLASKGMEILVMVPSGDRDVSWEEHMPDTLQNLLEGCMFFRKEWWLRWETAIRSIIRRRKP